MYIEGIKCEKCEQRISDALKSVSGVKDVSFCNDQGFTEVYLDKNVSDDILKQAVESIGDYKVKKID